MNTNRFLRIKPYYFLGIIVVNKNSGRETNLLFNAKLQSAFIKYESHTLNTLFAHLPPIVLYMPGNSFSSVMIKIALCFPSCSVHHY